MINAGWKIIYHPAVEGDAVLLGSTELRRIEAAIERKLIVSPQLYGSPLRGTLHPLRKLRVGDWRVIYDISVKQVVRIIAIGHRRYIYRTVSRRF